MTDKDTFLQLISKITREGFKKEELINSLSNSDFFSAPASTKYHNSFEGGLVDHSLNVYYNMMSLNERKHLGIPEESIIIVSLFHDLYKRNFYKKSVQNKKVYSESGSKHDELGRYDWVSTPIYAVSEDRFLFGPNGSTSEFMISKFINLTLDESIAIVNMNLKDDMLDMALLNKCPLLTIAKCADILSCYIDEKIVDE